MDSPAPAPDEAAAAASPAAADVDAAAAAAGDAEPDVVATVSRQLSRLSIPDGSLSARGAAAFSDDEEEEAAACVGIEAFPSPSKANFSAVRCCCCWSYHALLSQDARRPPHNPA